MRLTSLALVAVLSLPGQAAAYGASGSYLAGRHASFENDFIHAAEYFTRALALDPDNRTLMEAVVTANINMDVPERGLPVARRMVAQEIRSQPAHLLLMAHRAKQGEFEALLEGLEAGQTVGGLVDGLAGAWALLGTGRTAEAMERFAAIAGEPGLGSFGTYHTALARAALGDFEGSLAALDGQNGPPVEVSRHSVRLRAQVLAELGRPEEALDAISAVFGSNLPPEFVALSARLEAGDAVGFDMAEGPREGLAEVLYGVSTALMGEIADGYTLIYARMASYLDPKHVDALLLAADLLEDLGQYELAIKAYDRVPRDHPSFVSAEIGRAVALQADDRPDAAVEVLRALTDAFPEQRDIHRRLGDTLRSLERFEEAAAAYDAAVALIETPTRADWPLYFARGIARERTGAWPQAEADFRRALELEPGQPQVLNYLGYSLVEMRKKLDEALTMIEAAVEAEPQDGYITDSLGWVLYRLGRYEEAVAPMERAAELMPTDPIINDHLGDVYWAVGRELEARFQWRRALSFDPEPEEAARIERKLEVGLDRVLDEEGAPPLDVASDG